MIALAIFTMLVALVLVLAAWLSQPLAGRGEPPPPSVRADPQRLEGHVRALADFSPRDFEHPERLAETAKYLGAALQSYGLTSTEQPYAIDGVTFMNVITAVGPSDGELVVVGAHYDAAGPTPGADDNASGTAALLELARLWALSPPPETRIELVFYTLEEQGFRTPNMGSGVHARSLKARGATVRAMFSLEMLGCFTDAPSSQTFPIGALSLLYPTVGNFITVVGSFSEPSLVRNIKRAMQGASSLPVESINAPRFIRGVDFSDHLSYWNEGYPAVMITDTAFYRNPRYHTEEDTPETLDYARMAEVVRQLYAAVLALARR
jgi:Zn-dependent M28 family amino/carboxypeptidase